MGGAILDDMLPPAWLPVKAKLIWAYDNVSATNLAIFVALIFGIVYNRLAASRNEKLQKKKEKEKEKDNVRPPIETLENFDWRAVEPLQLRPFKSTFHVTMALETMEPSELILMDKTYKDRIMYRRQLLKDHHDVVIQVRNEGTDPRVRAAVGELYNFTMGFYLPTRYPRMFKLVTAEFDKERTQLVQNLVTGELLPTDLSANRPASSALETLAKTVDEDMLILLPQQKRTGSEKKKKNQTGDVRRRNVNASGGHSSSADGAPATSPTEDTKYVLEAYEVCYPAGFDSRTKLGKRLADIHGPVPGYAEKIEKSMDRFFEKLEVGKFVKRANWGITTDSDLFSAFGGIHAAKGEKLKPLAREDLDVDNTFLRCERQTLYRLPQTGAIVFAFHTYRYSIRQIKEEGQGKDLATAIEGITGGSVPAMGTYKRVPVWGEAVKEYLRSESET